MKLSLIKILKEEQIKHLVPSLDLFDNILVRHQRAIEIVSKIYNISLDEAASMLNEKGEENLKNENFQLLKSKGQQARDLLKLEEEIGQLIYIIHDFFLSDANNPDLLIQFTHSLRREILTRKSYLPDEIKDIILKEPIEKWERELQYKKNSLLYLKAKADDEYQKHLKLTDDFIYKTAEVAERAFEKLLMDNKLKNIVSILPHKIVAFQNQGIEITDYLDEIWKVNEVVGLAKVYFDDINFEKEEKILYDILADWS